MDIRRHARGSVTVKKLLEYLKGKTDEDIMDMIAAHEAKIEAVYGDIPDDKDCAKCPHAVSGQWVGMVTPCFDICSGDAFGDDCGESSDGLS